MPTSKKRPGAARSNRAAMDAATKKPRIVSHDVVLDDEAADLYDEAVAKLAAREKMLLESRPRRIAAAKAALPIGATDEQQAAASAAVFAEDEAVLDELRAVRDQAEADLEHATQTYRFRALGRSRWEALKAEHPAEDSDHEEMREATGKDDATAEYHFETLAPALVQESCVSPRLTVEQVAEMYEGGDWNQEELAGLFQHALLAQMTARKHPRNR